MLQEEQIDSIKSQLISQIEQTFPLEKQDSAKSQIISMNPQELEQFLIQNNLIPNSPHPEVPSKNSPPQCIFCSIIQGQVPTYQIDENKDSIAVLDINPISKAHALVIPKQHLDSSEKIPSTAFTLAKKVSKKIKTKFKPKDISIYSSNIMGHEIINILPIYKEETPASERKKASEPELETLKKELKTKKRIPKARKPKTQKISEKKLWLPIRIP